MLEQIVKKEPSDERILVEHNGKSVYVLSDKSVYESLGRMIKDKMSADTAATLGLDYEPTVAGVVGVDRGSELLEKIVITKNAFAVGVDYAQKMCSDGSLELGLHMLHQVDAPFGLVTDLVPAYNQKVTGSSCDFKNYSSFDYPEDRDYAGWCHSHANLDVFHSGQDDANVLRKLDRKELEIPGTFINYIPSLVINTRGEYHGAMGIRWDLGGVQKKIVDNVRVKFIDDDIDTIVFDFEKFRKENIRRYDNGFYQSRERAREDSQQRDFRASKEYSKEEHADTINKSSATESEYQLQDPSNDI